MTAAIEKVLTLRTVAMFAGTPDAVLAEVADAMDEVDVYAGDVLFNKGDSGASMYVISAGRLRVHDGDYTIEELGEGQIVGEMAVLDAAQRLATVTALEDTHLLQLDQDTLFELMTDHGEVLRGILRVMSGRLRARIAELQTRAGE